MDFRQARSILVAMVHTIGEDDLPPTESSPPSETVDPASTHYVSRILDPEVTPPPGGKQSDRGGQKQRGSA
jgi:hypothetical protein